MLLEFIVPIVIVAVLATLTVWVVNLRRVVSTNEVHIIQSSKKTVSYGKDQETGNTYYEWPSWIPFIGIQVIKLPVSVFSLRLNAYEAYDSGRLPFVLDLEAFFRIENSNVAAQRVFSTQELNAQLTSILQGAARTILASKTIEEIMQGRAEFGVAFTSEVNEQLKAWGVTTVKNIELMDIRDSKESQVIQNIMDKKKSEIEKESRIVVAENIKAAQNAEIDAQREVEINRQLAEKQVGIKTAEKNKEVGIAQEKSQQEIKQQQKVTAEKQMEVSRVESVKTAEIAKDVNIVKAEEQKQTEIVKAEGEKQKTVLIAEGTLEAEKREAEGIKVQGEAKALAEKQMQLAPVEAQIVLAKEIGENQSYQQYLITIRQVEAQQSVGIQQALALAKSDIKVIANSGSATDGISSIGQLFTSKGGTGMASALEGLAQSEIGKGLLDKFLGSNTAPKE
jgi:flotillin